MDLYQPGQLVRSKAGHDAGQIFLILSVEGEWLILSDGRLRPMDKPKRKKKKHTQPIHLSPLGGLPETDEQIKRAIKLYMKEATNV